MSTENPSRGWRRQGQINPKNILINGKLQYTFSKRSLKWIHSIWEAFESLDKAEQIRWQEDMALNGLSKTFGPPPCIETETKADESTSKSDKNVHDQSDELAAD